MDRVQILKLVDSLLVNILIRSLISQINVAYLINFPKFGSDKII